LGLGFGFGLGCGFEFWLDYLGLALEFAYWCGNLFGVGFAFGYVFVFGLKFGFDFKKMVCVGFENLGLDLDLSLFLN
jgi:hypothetical protein